METWRAEALKRLPELEQEIEDAENPMALWIEVCYLFETAYDEPRDEGLIERIYRYAFWCLEHGDRAPDAGNDLPTCVVVAFYEHIPANPAARRDMPRWFTRDEVLAMREVFTYHYDGDFEELLQLFPAEQSNRNA